MVGVDRPPARLDVPEDLSKSFITARADQTRRHDLVSRGGRISSQGMQVLASTDVAPQLMAEEGVLTRRAPNRREMLDIQFGWSIARQMGQLDIGQSIIVRDRTVLGVEAIEGTDALVARMAALCPRGRFYAGESCQASAGYAF